jgi:hypothetical protein
LSSSTPKKSKSAAPKINYLPSQRHKHGSEIDNTQYADNNIANQINIIAHMALTRPRMIIHRFIDEVNNIHNEVRLKQQVQKYAKPVPERAPRFSCHI